jgi:hypothetical protein
MVLLLNDVRADRNAQEVDEQTFLCILKLMSMHPGDAGRWEPLRLCYFSFGGGARAPQVDPLEVNRGPGNRRIPILFIRNIFHCDLGLCARNLFSHRPCSHRVAVSEVIIGALKAFLQRNHGAVIERCKGVPERSGG